jgi:hypothetical protein
MIDGTLKDDIESILKDYIIKELSEKNIVIDDNDIDSTVDDAIDSAIAAIDDFINDLVENAVDVNSDDDPDCDSNFTVVTNDNDIWKDCWE